MTSTPIRKRSACCAASCASKSSLKVIDADIMALMAIAQDQNKSAANRIGDRRCAGRRSRERRAGPAPAVRRPRRRQREADAAARSHSRRERPRAVRAALRQHRLLEAHRRRIPEPADRHRHRALRAALTRRASSRATPSSTIRSAAAASCRSAPISNARASSCGRSSSSSTDGPARRCYSESYREEILYNSQQNTPALSSYFELMDRLVPELPERAEQPEDQGHARAAEIATPRQRKSSVTVTSPAFTEIPQPTCANAPVRIA